MKPITTEKAVKLIELNNIIVMEVDRKMKKNKIKEEMKIFFNVEVDEINTLIRKNKKYAYIRLNKKNPAIDLATKLGMI